MATIHKALPLSGGAGLNFKVVGSTIEPTNPSDNTIWVNTAVPINRWMLNGKEPTNRYDESDLQAGDVWIKTLNSNGTVSFNALKKNMIDLQLDKVYQWDGSKWTVRSAYSYENESGIQISNGDTPDYLYNAGTWNTWHLTGFSNDTESSAKFNVASSTSVAGGESSRTVTATSNENIDWSTIEYVTFNGTWHGHTDQSPAVKASSLTIKIGDQIIPLNTKTAVETNETLPITISVYTYVSAYVESSDGYVSYGVTADVDITSILTE